jgi:hypothetical protein
MTCSPAIAAHQAKAQMRISSLLPPPAAPPNSVSVAGLSNASYWLG